MATQKRPGYRSIVGNELGIGARGEIASRMRGASADRITSPCTVVTGTISAEGASVANQRDIALIFKDRQGNPIDYVADVELHVTLNAAGNDFAATGGSTGIAAGAAGKLLAVVAKKLFRCKTSAAGLLSVIYTDTGTEACHLHVKLPNGEMVYIGNLTNT